MLKFVGVLGIVLLKAEQSGGGDGAGSPHCSEQEPVLGKAEITDAQDRGSHGHSSDPLTTAVEERRHQGLEGRSLPKVMSCGL